MIRLLLAGRGERGSIPLALLVVIALSAVIGALALTVVGGSRQVRFDQDYTGAIQAADTGAQEGAAYLMRTLTLQDLSCEVATCPDYAGVGTTTDTSGVAVDYALEAAKVASLTWEVTAAATVDGVTREVAIEVADRSRFFVAAFSDRTFTMVGSNGADSYGATWSTGNGIVASNGRIDIGGSTDVDGVHLYDWRNNASFDRCDDHGGADDCAPAFGGCPSPTGGIPPGRSCTDLQNLPDPTGSSARIDDKLEVGGSQLETQFIDDQLTSGCPLPILDYTTSTYDGGSGVLGTNGMHTTYCFDDVTINDPLTVRGTVDVYVYGNLLITEPAGNKGNSNDNSLEVNCAGGCSPGTSTPDARTLSFYVDGSGDDQNPSLVQVANQSAVVAGIYAPESTCEGSPSNAQSDIFGSLICGTISNQGGWEFHFDDRLLEEGTGEYIQRAWREE